MKRWDRRPSHTALNLNPAFCGEILRRVLYGWGQRTSGPMPLSLTFLPFPILLHKGTRNKFSQHTRISLHTWLQENPEVRVGLAERVKRFGLYSYESLAFLLSTDNIVVTDGRVDLVRYRTPPSLGGRDDEVAEIFLKGAVVGRWFGEAGPPENVYTMLGIRPV